MSFPRLARPAVALLALSPFAAPQSIQFTDQNVLAVDDVAITPDQQYAVVRENNCLHFARVYDLASWTLAATVPGTCNPLAGECTDAVEVTNSRAVVLGGGIVQILDLTAVATAPLLAQHPAGFHPRDVAITPDGTIAVVRGGATLSGLIGGQYLFDLASGAQIGFAPGEPTPYPPAAGESFEVDDVEVTDAHAVVTSYVPALSGPTTRVTIWELHPAGGGLPVVVFETTPCLGCGDQPGAPYDLAISPDGSKAVVRSEFGIGAYDLSVSPPVQVWQRRPHEGPGYYAEEALDAVVASDQHVVTISRVASGGAQVDVLDWAGGQRWHRLDGSPHDLVLTPDATRALIRTNASLAMYDLANLAPPGAIVPAAQVASVSGVVGYFAGFDSVAANDDYAVTLARIAGLPQTKVEFWDVSGSSIQRIATTILNENRPTDVELLPDGTRVAVSGTAGVGVYDLETGVELLHQNAVGTSVWWGWCDGLAVRDGVAVAVGMYGPQQGWVMLVDVAPFESSYCVGAPNSAGPGAFVHAGGTASVASGPIDLLVAGMPPSARGLTAYGAQTAQTPFGNGFQCIAGTIGTLPAVSANGSGAAAQVLDFAQHPAVQPGATLHFQHYYRDPAAGGALFNTSNAMTVTFVP